MNRRQVLTGSIGGLLLGSLPAISVANATSRNAALKPRRLRKGDTVGLIAPASNMSEDESIRFAIDVIHSFGFKVKEGAHLYDRDQYLAGTDRDRADDVNWMFAHESVDAIFCLRGGYGTSRILPFLDYDMIARNPKVFLGFSDITAILLALHVKAGLVGFHGPTARIFTDYTLAEFNKVLMQPVATTIIGAPPPIETRAGVVESRNRISKIAGGTATGELIGGNLSLIVTLVGTPYEPDFNGRILFIEETHEEPYRIDRMLTQLWLAGKLQQTAGIVFGKITDSDTSMNTFSLEEVIRRRCGSLGVPVIRGLMIGHVADQTVVPIGIKARLDADAGTLQLLEPAVL
jgi:muramoyltetrapeptide carboxypeptidase